MTDPRLDPLEEALIPLYARMRRFEERHRIEAYDNGKGATAAMQTARQMVRQMLPAILAHLPQSQAERDGEALLEVLKEIAFMGSDCPAAMSPETFYRYQLYQAISTAARAVNAALGDSDE